MSGVNNSGVVGTMKNLSMPAAQQGFSKFGLLMTLIVLVCVLTFGLKVLPVYIDHNFVKGVAEDMVESGRASSMTQAEVREEVGRGLAINNVRGFDINNITTSINGGDSVISIKYERRIPLFSNVDIVVSFDDRVE
ncbi:MAG: DUF4845 domain-containing protein [Gammaproteobacteria bacterium]|nr:DUF4845 domain-containing protein [Gammaproteobacteria bacterium]